MAHKHAEVMKQYAEDAATHDRPWELWEYTETNGCTYTCENHPSWCDELTYCRKPRVIMINGHEVPEPLRVKPAMNTNYWVVSTGGLTKYYTWRDDAYDNILFTRGLCHLTKSSAEAHAKALLSFTQIED